MSSYNPLFAQDQTAWLFEIGQKLRVAYDDIADLCLRISLRSSKCLKSPLRRPANNPPAPLALLTSRRGKENLLVLAATSPLRFEKPAVCGRDVHDHA
jgi:hypothetical protein